MTPVKNASPCVCNKLAQEELNKSVEKINGSLLSEQFFVKVHPGGRFETLYTQSILHNPQCFFKAMALENSRLASLSLLGLNYNIYDTNHLSEKDLYGKVVEAIKEKVSEFFKSSEAPKSLSSKEFYIHVTKTTLNEGTGIVNISTLFFEKISCSQLSKDSTSSAAPLPRRTTVWGRMLMMGLTALVVAAVASYFTGRLKIRGLSL